MALKACLGQGMTLTAQSFATYIHAPCNRHLRAVLNHLVCEGYLVKRKTLFDDGHYRMTYAAQKTNPLSGFLS